MVLALLLLAEVSGSAEGASNPGFVARITRKGLEYGKGVGHPSGVAVAHQSGVATGRRGLRNAGFVTLWASVSSS